MSNSDWVAEVKRLLGEARIFGCRFTKRDGSKRTGSFRLKVKRGLTGAGPRYDTDAYGNIVVWDMNKGGYRTIALRRVDYFTVQGRRVTTNRTPFREEAA